MHTTCLQIKSRGFTRFAASAGKLVECLRILFAAIELLTDFLIIALLAKGESGVVAGCGRRVFQSRGQIGGS